MAQWHLIYRSQLFNKGLLYSIPSVCVCLSIHLAGCLSVFIGPSLLMAVYSFVSVHLLTCWLAYWTIFPSQSLSLIPNLETSLTPNPLSCVGHWRRTQLQESEWCQNIQCRQALHLRPQCKQMPCFPIPPEPSQATDTWHYWRQTEHNNATITCRYSLPEQV